MLYIILGFVVAILLLLSILFTYLFYRGNSSNGGSVSCKGALAKKAAKEVQKYMSSHKGAVIIPKADMDKMSSSVGSEDMVLLQIAMYAAKYAEHVVISHYKVGACVKGKSGNVYLGANFEIPRTLILTVHGEQCSTHHAAVNGEKGLEKIAVNEAPCGMCRQFLVELGNPKDLQVIFCEKNVMLKKPLEDIIPDNFGPQNLGFKGVMLDHPPNSVLATVTTPQEKAALKAAQLSYTPYTHRPCGASILFKDGKIIYGLTLENAAYNTGTDAMRNVASLIYFSGHTPADIVEFCMVEQICCTSAQRPVSRRPEGQIIAQALNPNAKFTYISGQPEPGPVPSPLPTLPLPL